MSFFDVRSRRLVLLASAAALAATGASAAEATDQHEATVEGVVVTAQRYESVLEKTPIAIAVLGDEAIEAANIDSSMDLSLAVPGFVMTSNIVQGQAYLRGIGTDIASISADPSVAFILDGVYLPRLSTAQQDLFDVQRVEVVKGPQGTLYGRNATGGVVAITSKTPSSVFEGSADALYGNYDQQRYRATISGPLSDGVAGRVSVVRRSRDGFVYDPIGRRSIDNVSDWAGRAMLTARLGDSGKLTLSADATRSRGAPSSAIRIISAKAPALAFGGTVVADRYKTNQNFPNQAHNDQSGVSAKIDWALGGVDVTSITAYRESDFKLVLDLDGTEANWFTHDPDRQKSKTFSQELQLAGKTDRLQWLAGAYFFSEDASASYNLFLPLAGVNQRPEATNETRAYAVFAQGGYSLTDRFKATVGLRYSYEKKDASVDLFFNGAKVGAFDGDKSWDAFTPKFGLEFQATDTTLIYGSVTRGFKSGGFNSTAIQNPQDFRPEYVWAYETGLKSVLADGRARIGLTAFYYDYTDLQVNKYDAVNIVTLENAANAKIKGFEAELAAQPTDRWNVSAALTLLDATYDKFTSVDPDNAAAGPLDLKGNRLVRTPKTSLSLSTDYTFDLGGGLELTARGSYAYRSRIYFTPFNATGVSQKGYGLANASLDLKPSDGPWRASVFVKNLGKSFYYQEIARSANIVGTIGWPGDPRTYGVEFGVSF